VKAYTPKHARGKMREKCGKSRRNRSRIVAKALKKRARRLFNLEAMDHIASGEASSSSGTTTGRGS
jgi:hypothetical protein